MCVNEEIQQVKSEIKQLEAQQLELSKRKRKGIATEDELAELDHLSSVLSRRQSDLHDLRKTQAPPVQVRENPPKLVAFHDACKNISHQFEGGSVIKLPDGVFILGNQSFGSSIYVRQCYLELLNLSLDIIAQPECRHLVILGNPGIGKTFFGYFMLILLLQQGETVVYETKRERYLFSPTLTAKGSPFDFAPILDNQSTFYLVDAVEPLNADAKTVLVTSPRRDIWYSFHKHKCTVRYMPVWDFDEIKQCRSLLFPNVSEQRATELFNKWGGIPRFVLEYAHDKLQQKNLNNALNNLQIKLVLDSVQHSMSDENTSHRLVHIKVDNFEEISYDFASEYVRKEAVKNLLKISTHDVLLFLATTRNQPEWATFAGYLFEGYAHQKLSSGGSFPIRELHPDPNIPSPQTLLTLKKMPTFEFDKAVEISSQGDHWYFQPKSKSFPAIDSCIKPNLLFQMTTSLDHPCKEKHIKNIIKHLGKPLETELYFVVPSEDCFEKFKYQMYKSAERKNVITLPDCLIRQYVLSIDTTVYQRTPHP